MPKKMLLLFEVKVVAREYVFKIEQQAYLLDHVEIDSPVSVQPLIA